MAGAENGDKETIWMTLMDKAARNFIRLLEQDIAEAEDARKTGRTARVRREDEEAFDKAIRETARKLNLGFRKSGGSAK